MRYYRGIALSLTYTDCPPKWLEPSEWTVSLFRFEIANECVPKVSKSLFQSPCAGVCKGLFAALSYHLYNILPWIESYIPQHSVHNVFFSLANLLVVDIKSGLLQIAIDTHLSVGLCALGEAAACYVEHRLRIPVRFIEIEHVFLCLAIVCY